MGLREAGRNHLHLSWYLVVPGITSYGQKLGENLFTVHGKSICDPTNRLENYFHGVCFSAIKSYFVISHPTR